MGIGLSGMVSGLDTDSIVKALMSTQRQKSTKIENKITTNEWKIEKWKDLNSKIYSMYTGSLYKMKTQGNYLTKRTASSNEKIVTAKASSIAALGTHTVKVSQTASAQYVTGKDLKIEGLTKNSKLSEIGDGVDVGTIVNITCGDKSERLEVKEDTTIQDFLDACKDAGLNANFDTARKRFYISSKKSGADNSFSITTETYAGNGLTVKNALNNLLDYSALSDADQEKIDKALEVIRNTTKADLKAVIEATDTKTLTTDQVNVLSAYNTIQNIAKDSVSSKLALNTIYDKISEVITNKDAAPVYGITYSEATLTKLQKEAEEAATAEWKQRRFERFYQSASEDDSSQMVSDFAKFDTEVTYEYIQELNQKRDKILAGQELTLTQEEQDILDVYDAKKTKFKADIARLENEEKPNSYTVLYEKELERLVEIEAEYLYKNSTTAQNAFETEKQKYKTECPEKKPENLTNEQWTTDYQTDWKTKHTAFTTELTKITTQLKKYAGTTTQSGANALEVLGISDINFGADGKLKDPSGTSTVDDGDTGTDGTGTNNEVDKGLKALEAKGMSFVYASNGLVEVDGAEYEADSNTITVNGLTLDLKMAKEDEEVTITITQDTDAVYNMVKDFVKEYNELLEEMNKAYNADSAREYEPLTDEQKDAMSEKEIEKWENKIKDSLLRRDNTLGSLINSMRSCLSGSVEFEGKSYALSSFGICSTNYSEKGKLHIYGDPDDSAGAMYDDKLRAAIEENPDAVMEVLQTLSENLYNTVSDKMKSTSLSSALTVYNDKKMTKEITSYKKELAELEKRLADMEARYYKQFTAMEKALSQMNSSANSLASMLGTGTQ